MIIEDKEYSDEQLVLIADHYNLSNHQLDSLIHVVNKKKKTAPPIFFTSLMWIEDHPHLLYVNQGFTNWLDVVEKQYCKEALDT